MDVYGNHRVVSICATGNAMRVETIDNTTGRREYRVIPYSEPALTSNRI